jgi:GR25 family glycosyltransferase involved in LPS biosynthesis
MKAHVIVLENNELSNKLADKCISTSTKVGNEFKVVKFPAIKPHESRHLLNKYNLKWNYPWNGEVVHDWASGLTKTGYQTAEPNKRIACFLSHYHLWMQCLENEEDYLVLEHDAYFKRKLDIGFLAKNNRFIVSINKPEAGATPRALMYEKLIVESASNTKGTNIVPVPDIRTIDIPAGLPGNSAYYIKPEGAKKMLSLVQEFGAWPNDAIMCKQLVGFGKLGCLYPFATGVQNSVSTTTL